MHYVLLISMCLFCSILSGMLRVYAAHRVHVNYAKIWKSELYSGTDLNSQDCYEHMGLFDLKRVTQLENQVEYRALYIFFP